MHPLKIHGLDDWYQYKKILKSWNLPARVWNHLLMQSYFRNFNAEIYFVDWTSNYRKFKSISKKNVYCLNSALNCYPIFYNFLCKRAVVIINVCRAWIVFNKDWNKVTLGITVLVHTIEYYLTDLIAAWLIHIWNLHNFSLYRQRYKTMTISNNILIKNALSLSFRDQTTSLPLCRKCSSNNI